MEDANRTGNQEQFDTARKIFDLAIPCRLDKEYGGLLYFIDCLGNPPESYEHDMKLWWPHNEILIASMMLYRDNRQRGVSGVVQQDAGLLQDVLCRRRIRRVVRLSAPRRQTHHAWPPRAPRLKGPFHLPRMLMMVDTMIGQILDRA